MLLAAHPDDETFFASASLSCLPHVHVFFLTDGAPHDAKLWTTPSRSRHEYAHTRRREAISALSLAGIGEDRITWLEVPDQESILCASRLLEKLAALLEILRPDFLLTHSYEGGHPDHDCAALVASLAVRIMLCSGSQPPGLLEMTSYHVRDGSLRSGEFLPHDGSHYALEIRLSPEELSLKRRMLACYASQAPLLEYLLLDREGIRSAPVYDFSQPPHRGQLWYEQQGWYAGNDWRKHAAAIQLAFGGARCR